MSKFLDNLLGITRVTNPSPNNSLGVSGVSVFGGYVANQETNAALAGTNRYTTYAKILANTAIVAGGTRLFLNLTAKAAWKVSPPEDSGDEGQRIAELIESIMHDMDLPWHRVVRRAALYRFYGFGVQEWTAKKRDDGVIGFLSIDSRPAHTIERWDLDSNGKVVGVIQRSPQDYSELYLPRSKIIYCVDDSLTDSPEGLGLFRHIVDASRRLARYEQLEGFGFETDLRGMPIGRAPFAALQQAVDNGKMTVAQKAAIEQPLKDFITNHIKNPQLGLLLDSLTYQSQDEAATPSPEKQWDMDLLKSASSSQGEVSAAIERLNREIARVLGVESLLLGGDGKGSQALSRDKSQNFASLVDGTLGDLGEVYEKDFLDPLFELNGWDKKYKPQLMTEALQHRDIEQITGALRDLAQAGALLLPDDPVINEVREMLGLSRPESIEIAMDLAQVPLNPPEPPAGAAPSDKTKNDPKPGKGGQRNGKKIPKGQNT